MTTDQLTGRALDEAAARAMGWRQVQNQGSAGGIFWCPPSGGVGDWEARCPEPTEREMLAWLHGRGGVEILTRKGYAAASQIDTDYHEGTDLREALARLVVAVAAREAKA